MLLRRVIKKPATKSGSSGFQKGGDISARAAIAMAIDVAPRTLVVRLAGVVSPAPPPATPEGPDYDEAHLRRGRINGELVGERTRGAASIRPYAKREASCQRRRAGQRVLIVFLIAAHDVELFPSA
jgi:hypothetical protein